MTTIIPILFGYIPLLVIIGFGIWLLFRLFQNIFSDMSASPITKDARIISRRQERVNGITYPFATFEFDDGSRKELVIVNGDYGILKEGDRGTVRFKGRYYKGFVRNANNHSTSEYVNRTEKRSTNTTQTYQTQSAQKTRQKQEKLQLGLERLSKAGNDPDLLGLALISLHGALEDSFRNWLSSNSSVPPLERKAVLDARQIQWKGLLDLMQQYSSLSNDRREYIFRMNRLRQNVGHGDRFTGTRSDLENYADFVRRFIDSGFSPTNANENDNNSSRQKGDDLRLDLRLTSQEAMHGTEKQVKISYLEQCEACNSRSFNVAKIKVSKRVTPLTALQIGT